MATTKRVRWICPNCNASVLGSTRPPANATVRYCLKCSAKSTTLVERSAPVLIKKQQASRKRSQEKQARKRRLEAEQARQLDRELYFIGDRDLRTVVTKVSATLEPNIRRDVNPVQWAASIAKEATTYSAALLNLFRRIGYRAAFATTGNETTQIEAWVAAAELMAKYWKTPIETSDVVEFVGGDSYVLQAHLFDGIARDEDLWWVLRDEAKITDIKLVDLVTFDSYERELVSVMIDMRLDNRLREADFVAAQLRAYRARHTYGDAEFRDWLASDSAARQAILDGQGPDAIEAAHEQLQQVFQAGQLAILGTSRASAEEE